MTRKDEFLEKFKALLREYDAMISVETRGYEEHPVHEVIVVVPDRNSHHWYIGKTTERGFKTNLGTWLNGKYYE